MLDYTIIVVEVSQEEDGGFVAEGLTEDIFTQGHTWEELKENVIEAVKGYYRVTKVLSWV